MGKPHKYKFGLNFNKEKYGVYDDKGKLIEKFRTKHTAQNYIRELNRKIGIKEFVLKEIE